MSKMVNTFLPYADFAKSAASLDSRRLVKQVVEAKQILDGQWSQHPASIMWREHHALLVDYYNACFDEAVRRGTKFEKMQRLDATVESTAKPWWLGNPHFHCSHQAMLLRKMPTHYSFPELEPFYMERGYVWPSKCTPDNIVYAPFEDIVICEAYFKNGNPCTARASVGNFCKRHAPK